MSPAVAKGRPASERVQGIDSSLSDLTLRSGSSLRAKIGGSIQPTPTLKRTISGASSIKLNVHDTDDRLLDTALLVEKWDAKLDGLWFRYMGAEYDAPYVDLTLEERGVALLRELKGPVRAYAKRGQPDELTRAEFIIGLVREARPRIPWHCPQLHEQQPIETPSQGKAAKEEAKANRGKGLGEAKGLTVKGEKATSAQIEIGERALRVAESNRSPFRVRVGLMSALIVESLLGKISSNYLQLIPSTAAASGIKPTDLEAAVHGFLTGYIDGEGGANAYSKANPGAEPYVIAQAVQRSGAGLASNGAANYGPVVPEAREWVEAYEGGDLAGGGSETVPEPRTFEVKKDETYWDAITRLAKEVNWRAFFVAGRFFLVDELELSRGMIRLAIDRDTPGIEKVKFKFNTNRPATEVTVEAYAKQWNVPPGAVVTLEGYGPASLGFGDAPVKADAKGRKAAISSNRKAKTGEGRARYLVESVESPIRDDEADARLVTIKLKKPTAPLPEPAAETKTVGGGGGTPGTSGMGVLEGTPEEIVNQVVDYAHSNGFPDVTRESVRAANASHGPTISGSTSDHQGPPTVRWAADISNGSSPTKEMDRLAAAIAEALDAPNWDGSGLITWERDGYRFQLIYRTMEGGDHFNHVHFGVSVA